MSQLNASLLPEDENNVVVSVEIAGIAYDIEYPVSLNLDTLPVLV